MCVSGSFSLISPVMVWIWIIKAYRAKTKGIHDLKARTKYGTHIDLFSIFSLKQFSRLRSIISWKKKGLFTFYLHKMLLIQQMKN